MNFKQAKKDMRKFALQHGKGKGVTVDLTELIFYLRDDATRKQEKVLAKIYNRIHNKYFEQQIKDNSITHFAFDASEYNI